MMSRKNGRLRIAFANPRPLMERIGANFPPVGILSITAYLGESFGDEIEIRIFDQNVVPNIIEDIIRFEPDIVGVSSLTTNIPRAYRLCDELREKTDARIIIGGRHASAVPEEAVEHAHYAVIGEGEVIMKDIVEAMLSNNLPPEGILEGVFIKELDDIPPLPYHYLDMNYYLDPRRNITATMRLTKQTLFRKYKYNSMGVITSRGCPFKCIYCYNSKKNSPIRYHSAERCIDEVSRLIREYNVNTVVFVDDEFLTNRRRLTEFCDLIKRKNLKFDWCCQARSDVVSKEVLQLISSCGCRMVQFGFESGSDNVLKLLGKGGKASVESNSRAVQLCNDVGIKASAAFMLGAPGETHDDIKKTCKFIKGHKILAGLAITTPYPGTVLWDRCIEQGLIDPRSIDYSKLNFGFEAYLNDAVVPYEEFKRIHRGLMNYVTWFRRDLSIYEKIKRVIPRLIHIFKTSLNRETIKTFKDLIKD